jgi:DNA-binding response OmpR family regulator
VRLRPPMILVIDDDRETLELLRLALERGGFGVLIAADWDDASSQIEYTYMEKRPIEAIVLDLMMPERSGFDILRALQVALVPLPPVIMLTAVTGIEQQIQARDLGAAKYLTKPTTPSKLIEVIKEVLPHS